MYGSIKEYLQNEIQSTKDAGLYKEERVISSSQDVEIVLNTGKKVINFCANNYLGLSNNTEVIQAAKDTIDTYGFGMSSVRFICGTQEIHKQLEEKVAEFFHCEDTILYPAAFDANGGVFEPLLTKEDAIISDSLNHASIIDGVRLCKANRYRYANNDMKDLEYQLIEANKQQHRFKIIVTDGVFSMDGTIAKLDEICDLADKYNALVHFDDCHASGFVGANGRGTHEYHGCMDHVDIITGTLGKALGGGSGGFTSARQEVVDLLRQRSRPYLFSNTVAPPVVAGAIKALQLVTESNQLQQQLTKNTEFFRDGMESLGFRLLPGEHPIVPVMLDDAALAAKFAERMLAHGVYVVAFSNPVVAHGKARIRTQMSAAHSRDDLELALGAFAAVKRELGI